MTKAELEVLLEKTEADMQRRREEAVSSLLDELYRENAAKVPEPDAVKEGAGK